MPPYAKTWNLLKFPRVPKTPEPISVVSGPKLAILWRHVEEILLFNKYADGDFLRYFCILYFQRVMQDPPKKSPSGHHPITLSGYICATKARIDNRKKNLLNSNVSPTSPHNTVLASLRRPCKFQRVSRLGSVTARHFSSGRQPNFVALNRGRHLYLAGRPSRWALAHISSWSLALSSRWHFQRSVNMASHRPAARCSMESRS